MPTCTFLASADHDFVACANKRPRPNTVRTAGQTESKYTCKSVLCLCLWNNDIAHVYVCLASCDRTTVCWVLQLVMSQLLMSHCTCIWTDADGKPCRNLLMSGTVTRPHCICSVRCTHAKLQRNSSQSVTVVICSVPITMSQ